MDIPPQSSPKRKEPAGEEKLVQLDDLRTLLKEERQSWKEELKHEFQGWRAKVSTTLEKFEGELSQAAGKIQTVQSSVEALQRDSQAEASRVSELEKRMGSMETRSTTLGSHAEGENERRRALIMGGWSEDNVAANTLESAKAMVAQLRPDIDLSEASVPGIRRGYVILPYSARTGETESQCQERLRGAMARVRQANILTGEEGPQGPRRLWLNFSTPPDRRKRAILAGKIKRAVLEAGGRKDQLEVEFATASVWFRGKKVAGEGTAPHDHVVQVGCGWVDENALAGMLGEHFKVKWMPLKGAIR